MSTTEYHSTIKLRREAEKEIKDEQGKIEEEDGANTSGFQPMDTTGDVDVDLLLRRPFL